MHTLGMHLLLMQPPASVQRRAWTAGMLARQRLQAMPIMSNSSKKPAAIDRN